MQYENNLRKKKKKFSVKHKIWLSKSLFPKGTSGKRGSSYNQGRLIFGSIQYYTKIRRIIQNDLVLS